VPPDPIEQWTANAPGVRGRAGDATIALPPASLDTPASPALPVATQDAIEDDGL
jgi:hypothetical protein